MAKAKPIYQAPAPKEHNAFTAQITKYGEEMQALSNETRNLTNAFAGIVGKLPVLGAFVKGISDILTVRQQFGKVLEGIPKLLGYGDAGGSGGTGGAAGAAQVAGAASAAGPLGLVAAGAVVASVSLYALSEKATATGVKFAELANPGTVNLYNRAIMDAEAVLGERFTPVVEVATNVMQGVGDFFVEILPSTATFRNALMELNPAIQEVKDLARDVAPPFRAVFATGVQIAGEGLKLFAKGIEGAVKWIRNLTGIQLGAGPQGLAMGSAAANASVGGVEDVSRKMFEIALSQGRKGAEDPGVQTAGFLSEIKDKIFEFFGKNMWTRLGDYLDDFLTFLMNPVEYFAQGATTAYHRLFPKRS